LTDGTKYLADTTVAHWLMDAAASHFDDIGKQDWFVLIRLAVQNHSAIMVYEDGNGHDHVHQKIEYIDFPLSQIQLFACWNGLHWVIMLPSEY
jgi:hypothetical protein